MSLTRLNLKSVSYTGTQSFPADSKRGYFFIHAVDDDLTIEFGSGGGLLPLEAGNYYEPPVCPLNQIDVVTAGTFIVISNVHL